MFNDRGNFLCPEVSLPFTIQDKDLLDLLFTRFFSDELVFLSGVVEPLEKKKRNFKTKCGSCVVYLNGKYYIKSSDGKNMYPLRLTSTAHKPCNGPRKTRSFPRIPHNFNS